MTELSITDHWLDTARRIPSPNFNRRPEGCAIDLLVLHNISLPPGQFGGGYVESFFQNALDGSAHPYFAEIEGLQVSSHLLIDREGVVTQFVGFDQRAWHAGRSIYRGREACNDFSIGIELEGADDIPYTQAQYRALAEVVAVLLSAYPALNADRIAGHCDIAPGRKTDPGDSFDWPYFRRLLTRIT